MPTKFIQEKVSEVVQTVGNVSNDVAGSISTNLYIGSQKVDGLELARNLIDTGAHIVNNIPDLDDIRNHMTQILHQKCIKQAEDMVDTIEEIIVTYEAQIRKIAKFWHEIKGVIFDIVRGDFDDHKATKLANRIASSIESELRAIGDEINKRLRIGGCTIGLKTGASASAMVGIAGNVGFLMGGNGAAVEFGVFGDVGVSAGAGARADGKVDLTFSSEMPSGMSGTGLTCMVAGGYASGFQIGIDFGVDIQNMSVAHIVPTGVTIGVLAGVAVVTGIGLDYTKQFCLLEFNRKNNYKRAAVNTNSSQNSMVKVSRWSNWATKNHDPNGQKREAISLKGKNCIVVQEQPGYGIVDIGFGVNNTNWVTSTGNTSGKSIIKSFYGKILKSQIKEQFGYGIIDINFSYTNDGFVSETGWFTNNMDHNRKTVVELEDGADAAAQVLEQSGYGVINFRLGCLPSENTRGIHASQIQTGDASGIGELVNGYHGCPDRHNCFWVYPAHQRLQVPRWDTHHSANVFCTNCVKINSSTPTQYRCRGHTDIVGESMNQRNMPSMGQRARQNQFGFN